MWKTAVLVSTFLFATITSCKIRDSDSSQGESVDISANQRPKGFSLLSGVGANHIKIRCGRLIGKAGAEETDYVFGYVIDSQRTPLNTVTTKNETIGKIERKVLENKLKESEPGSKLTASQVERALEKICDSDDHQMQLLAAVEQDVQVRNGEWKFIHILEQMMSVIIVSGENLPLEYSDYFE